MYIFIGELKNVTVIQNVIACWLLVLGPERMTSSNQLSMYVRHWKPSSLTLGPLKEVVVDDLTTEKLKEEVGTSTCGFIE